MPKLRDLGDVVVTCNIAFGLKFEYHADSDEEEARRNELINKMTALKEEDRIVDLEGELMDMLIQALGYTEDDIKVRLAEREDTKAANRKAETDGRQARMKRRVSGRS